MDITKMSSGFRKALEPVFSECKEAPQVRPNPTQILTQFIVVFQYDSAQYCNRVSAMTTQEALQLARIDAAMQGYSGKCCVSAGLLIPDCSSVVDH